MKVLVTGGAGFIGSEIVKQLRDKTEAEIVVLDALTKQIHGEDPENRICILPLKTNVNLSMEISEIILSSKPH